MTKDEGWSLNNEVFKDEGLRVADKGLRMADEGIRIADDGLRIKR